jgi:leucyl aminopeptidase
MPLVTIDFAEADPQALAAHEGRVAAFADAEPDPTARRIDRLTKGAVTRAMASPAWSKLKPGEGLELAFPAGMAARALHLIRLPKRPEPAALRKAGALIGKALGEEGALVAAAALREVEHLAEGIALRAYQFARKAEAPKAPGAVVLACKDPDPPGSPPPTRWPAPRPCTSPATW